MVLNLSSPEHLRISLNKLGLCFFRVFWLLVLLSPLTPPSEATALTGPRNQQLLVVETNDRCLGLSYSQRTKVCKKIVFSSCSELRQRWPYGVASSNWSQRKYALKSKVNPLGYAKNNQLDEDKDGIACEALSDSGWGGRCPWLNKTDRRYRFRFELKCLDS